MLKSINRKSCSENSLKRVWKVWINVCAMQGKRWPDVTWEELDQGYRVVIIPFRSISSLTTNDFTWSWHSRDLQCFQNIILIYIYIYVCYFLFVFAYSILIIAAPFRIFILKYICHFLFLNLFFTYKININIIIKYKNFEIF